MLPESGDCHSLCELPAHRAEDADAAKPEPRPHQRVDEKTQLRNSLDELTNSSVLILLAERLHDDVAEEEDEEESTSADPWTPSVAISGEPRRVMTDEDVRDFFGTLIGE